MLRTTLFWLTILLPVLAAGGPSILHHESPADWRHVPAAGAAEGGTLGFTAFGRAWELELSANARLASRLGIEGRAKLGSGLELYRGRIAGVPGSWLRLTRDAAGGWSGILSDGRDLWAVESPAAVAGLTELPVTPGSGPVIFRVADLHIEPGTLGCAVDDAPAQAVTAKAGFDALVQELGKAATSRIDIAVIGDAAFAARHADPVAALATRLNSIDGIFSEQVGVSINVTEFRVFGAADDPFTDSADAQTLLDELGRYKSAEPALRGLGLVHLYTGRDLDRTTAGIAYVGALCNSRFGAALSEGRRTPLLDSLIGAHEIGHNFGAPHDGEAGSACVDTPETFLMAPSVNGSSTFSACSLEQMAPEIASALCLQPVADVDMALSASLSADTVLEGDELTLELGTLNLGTADAEEVALRVMLPDFLSVMDGGSACTVSAGGADCTVGTVAADGSAAATLTLAAETAGTGTIGAEVTAASDRDPANDTANLTVRVDPAADLAVTLQSPASLVSGGTATLRLEVSNGSDRTATALLVELSLPGSLAAQTASGSGAACDVSPGGVTCAADTLAGGATLSLNVDVAAAGSGSGTIRVTVSAAEADPDESDNAVSRSIEVETAASSAGSGGGGGGDGLWLLGALLVFLARRRA